MTHHDSLLYCSKLRQLHSLEICSGYVSDVGVAHLAAGLRRLRHLSLAHNLRVTSASLPLLAGLTQLTALNLSEASRPLRLSPGCALCVLTLIKPSCCGGLGFIMIWAHIGAAIEESD